MQSNNTQQSTRLRINHFIKASIVRVILDDGTSPGIMATKDAIKLAQENGLDLVEINPKGTPVVCRICDLGKLRYEEKKKQQIAKKKQTIQELKELVFRPNTDIGDMQRLVEHAKEFLGEGNRVKMTVKFRGREITHADLGHEKIIWMLEQLKGCITDQPQISLEGKFMWAVVSPIKQK